MGLLNFALVGVAIVCRLPALVGASSSRNPFLDQHFYINPVNAKEFDSSIATATGVTRSNLQKMQQIPSAYWIDRKVKIRGQDTTTVEGILKDASSKSPPELVVLMFYDLPNRDCDAKASNGEICCTKNPDGTCDYLAPGDCAEGIEEYKSGYVDPFASVLSEYDGKLQVVLVLEPDGLANLATNIADPHCGNMATQTAYKEGAKYAVEQITTKAPSVAIYLDAAHGGWLGWANNLEKFMTMLKEMALPFDKIRGFATNVANYQALGVQCPWCPDQGFRNGYCMNGKHSDDPCCTDPCKLLTQWNFGNNELNYAAGLVAAANSVLGMDAHVIIDTGRNGVADQRNDCANWCNPRGAGTGVPSTTKTANTSLVDAYFWLKTPGESDGCSQTLPSGKKCPRFDSKCASIDSIGTKDSEPAAPEAGLWFDFQVKQLAENAHFDPPVAKSDATCPASGGTAQAIMPVVASTQSSSMGGHRATGSTSGACAGAYQQCGGHDFSGPTCCQAGCRCSDNGGGFYSQCTPIDPSSGGTCNGGSSASSAAAVSTSTSPSQQGNSPMQVAGASSSLSGATSLGGPLSPATLPALAPSPASSRGGNSSPGQGLQKVRTPVPMSSSPLVPATQTLPASAPQSAGLSPSPEPAPTPSTLPATAPPPSLTSGPLTQSLPAQAAQQCAVPYGQCGGSGWSGPTCCDVYCTCQAMDATRSQCVPKGDEPGQASTVAIFMKDELPGSTGHGGKIGQGRLTMTAITSWVAMPLALVFAVLVAGLVRLRMRQTWRAYATLTPDLSQGVALATSVTSPDVEIA